MFEMVKPITCPHGITPKSKCKICVSEWQKKAILKYRIKNKEKLKEQRRVAYLLNPEKFREKERHYRKTHRDACRKRNRRFYRKNREKMLAKRREYYYKNKEKARKYGREYSKKLKKELVKLLGSKCIVCSSQKLVCFHEIHGKKHPLNYSYVKNHIEDFVCLCYRCHKTVHQIANNIEKIEKYLRLAKKIMAENQKGL